MLVVTPPRKRGRPKKDSISPEVQQRIVQAILSGNYLETAAAYGGIVKSTLYAWLRRGAKERDGPFKAFAEAVRKAQADAEVRDVALALPRPPIRPGKPRPGDWNGNSQTDGAAGKLGATPRSSSPLS